MIEYTANVNDNGDTRREDGPAILHVNGTKEWYVNVKCHREDSPLAK